MKQLIKIVPNGGKPLTSSRLIAQKFNKNHFDVLKAIQNMECSDNFRQCNFALSYFEQKVPTGGIKQQPEYAITKDGFAFIK